MRTQTRSRSGVPRLAVTAIVLVSTVGCVSAISRMFQTPLPLAAARSDFQLVDVVESETATRAPASFQNDFSRRAPAWLVNALPGYSSGHAPTMFYLPLDRSGDRLYEPAYVGTLRDPFKATLFGEMSGFARANSGLTSAPMTPLSVDGPAVWKSAPTDGNWNNDANWSPAAPNGPNGVALFGPSSVTSISLSANTQVADIVFSSTAGPYTIHVPDSLRLTISGAGVTNNSSVMQNFVAQGDPNGTNHATGEIAFVGSATAGNNRITYTAEGGGDAGTIAFFDSATAGTANFITSASPIGIDRKSFV